MFKRKPNFARFMALTIGLEACCLFLYYNFWGKVFCIVSEISGPRGPDGKRAVERC